MSGKQFTRRSGWSLVELICVISVLAVVMGVAAKFLSATYRYNAESKSRLELHVTMNRLATQFRHDARRSFSVVAEDSRITFAQSKNRNVVYQADDRGVIRTESESNQQTARDGFWLPKQWQPSWSNNDLFATMMLTGKSPTMADQSVTIRAHAGGDVGKEPS